MGYVDTKVANAVAERMTERYGEKHIAIHNNKSGLDVVMRQSDVVKMYGHVPESINVVYP